MRFNRMTGVAVVASVAAMISGTAVPNSAAGAVAVERLVTLDDFSQYADPAQLSAAYVRNANGGQNSVALVPSPFGAGLGNAMQFTYSYANNYSGRVRSIVGNWPGLKAVELWIKNGTPGQDVLLQFSDGASYEAHLNSIAGFDATSTAAQHIRVPIAAFTRKAGTGSGTLNTSAIKSFGLFENKVGAGTGGTIVLDDLQLVFDQATGPVSFPSTNLSADGVGNLITLLNQKATLPAGGKIVQATYTSSNPAVLTTSTDRFAPKGDFRAGGTTGIQLQQVKLFVNGATTTVTLNQALNVSVSTLPPAVDVVDFLRSTTGRGMLSAMHHDRSYAVPADADGLHQRVADEFGVYPALYSADFLTGATVPYRQNMINEVIRQWRTGNMVQIMFHVSPPQYTVAQEAQGAWGGDTAAETMTSPNRIFSYLYNDQWTQLMTNGTVLNTNWKRRMDEYARYLQQLEDAGVSVMLRPFHEVQQHVFWWGGRPGPNGTAGLYRMFEDYLERTKGLSNIIWVWDVQDLPDNYGWANGDAKFDRYEGVPGGLAEYNANDWSSFSPGKDYYDVLAVDFYDTEGYSQRRYDQAKQIAQADGKPMIIGETFTFPTQENLAAQPNWSLTMPWGARTWNYNTVPAMATCYSNSIGAAGLPRFTTRNNAISAP